MRRRGSYLMQRGIFRLAIVFSALPLAAACTSSTTSVASAPSATRCGITVSNSSSTFTATGGTGTVNVATERDCPWTITSSASWVSIAGERSGQGDAAITYSVAANPVPSPRSTSITVGSSSVQLNQAAAPCRFSISRSSDSVGSSGGRLTFDVSTLTGCAWTVATSDSWIAIVSGQSGNANATVTLSIVSNAGAQRIGHVTVAGQTYTVTQAAAPPMPMPAPSPSPTPSPSPSPTPAPTPTPTPTPVHLEGSISSLSGSCPNVTFTVESQRVTTNSSTTYRDGKCADLRNKRDVEVDAINSNGTLRATTIRVH